MIKFKEHDGLIFRMLDEPVPLKEDDENVLVRFITHGVIGEYVMKHWLDCNQPNVPIYIDDVDSDGDVTVWIDENRNEHHCCPFPMFEVIGILVKEGSKEWALYQIRSGKKVVKEGDVELYCSSFYKNRLFYLNGSGCLVTQNAIGLIDPCSEVEFLNLDKAGWQIYKEPNEEPQPTKEPIADCVNCKHVCTNSNIDHCYMYEPKPELQYKVGDWVEWTDELGKTCQGQVAKISDVELFLYKLYDIRRLCVPRWKITKVAPSEVVIHIGCISGKVRPVSTNGIHIWFHLIGVDDKTIATIRISSLDTQTRELVESLIKGQEEEK